MGLLNQSVQVYGKIPNLLNTLRQGQAPDKFNREFLKDIGFTSSNDLAFIPLLKGLGFLTSEGVPTQRYRDFLDQTRWKQVIAEAIKDAYGDIFVLKAAPSKADEKMIAGKFKSTYNLSDLAAERGARTFLALLDLADPGTLAGHARTVFPEVNPPKATPDVSTQENFPPQKITPSVTTPIGLSYNIQIHLPATKDIEVYNAIFKSLKEHIIG